jgi:hypothetical protein
MPRWPSLVLLGVGAITPFVLVGQNYVIQHRAWLRLKAEKREWEAAKPSGRCEDTRSGGGVGCTCWLRTRRYVRKSVGW